MNIKRLKGRPEGRHGGSREQPHLGSSLPEGVDRRCINILMTLLSKLSLPLLPQLSLPQRRPRKTWRLKTVPSGVEEQREEEEEEDDAPLFVLVDCAAGAP